MSTIKLRKTGKKVGKGKNLFVISKYAVFCHDYHDFDSEKSSKTVLIMVFF